MSLDSGIYGHISGTAVIEVLFPIDKNGTIHAKCAKCRYLSTNERICKLNGEKVAFPNDYRGEHCPLSLDDVISVPENLQPSRSGVSGYVKGTANIEVSFPIDRRGREYVRCTMCEYLSSNERFCWLNNEAVAFPKQYIGSRCPLDIEEPKNIPEGFAAFGED